MEQTFMKEKKILPLVLSMSMPMVLSMLVNALYNIVDSYFVAKISDEAMTALSLVYPLHCWKQRWPLDLVWASMPLPPFIWEQRMTEKPTIPCRWAWS